MISLQDVQFPLLLLESTQTFSLWDVRFVQKVKKIPTKFSATPDFHCVLKPIVRCSADAA